MMQNSEFIMHQIEEVRLDRVKGKGEEAKVNVHYIVIDFSPV